MNAVIMRVRIASVVASAASIGDADHRAHGLTEAFVGVGVDPGTIRIVRRRMPRNRVPTSQ